MRHALLTSISALLLVVALAFLIIGTISAPVVSSLKLASTSAHNFGIFGYCGGSDCSSAAYPVSFGDVDSSSAWFLGSGTRNTLSKAFIVAPIAAGLTFFALVFTVVSIFLQSPALKTLSLVFAVISFFASAVIAVIVVLVFHPYVAWLGWLLVAAAGCCLVALPLLLLSITARDAADDESDSENIQEQKFGDLPKMDSPAFAGGAFDNVPKTQYGYSVDKSAGTKDFSYRGTTNTYGPNDSMDSNKSLLESSPSVANDVTRSRAYMANAPGQSQTGPGYTNNFRNGPPKPAAPSVAAATEERDFNTGPASTTGSGSVQTVFNNLPIHDGPSTPVSATRHFAPNIVPSQGTSSTVDHAENSAPYPPNDRASSILNSRNYGVFDHHPSVEGHKPFTEWPEDDEMPERNSLDLPIDSDNESDFTSVSQRPPNAAYVSPQAPLPPQHFPSGQAQNHGYVPQMQNPQFQGYVPQGPGQYSGPPAQGRPPQGFAPGQYERSQPQFQQAGPPPPRPVNRPTVADNVLNNNPDFAIGGASRRKQGPGRPGFAPRPMQGGPGGPGIPGAAGFAPRNAQRHGPYGNL